MNTLALIIETVGKRVLSFRLMRLEMPLSILASPSGMICWLIGTPTLMYFESHRKNKSREGVRERERERKDTVSQDGDVNVGSPKNENKINK